MTKHNRAPRGALARDAVVAAAVEEFRTAQTVQDLTVGKVADRLGVKPMSLYTHIRNKDELVRAVAIELFLPLRADQISTRAELLTLYQNYYQLLIKYPALVQVVSTRWQMIVEMYPNVLKFPERTQFLVDEGITRSDSLVLLSALSRYTLGCAALFHSRPTVGHLTTTQDDLSPETDARAKHQIFEFGLSALIAATLKNGSA